VVTSPFAGVFRTSILSRDRRELADPPATTPAGDPVYVTIEEELEVIADAVRSGRGLDSLREQHGASAGEVVLILTCVDPMHPGDRVQPGSEWRLAYAGRAGVVRLVARPAETLEPVDEELGAILYGVWRPAPASAPSGAGSGSGSGS
jgi:hypothetical protein